MTAQTPEPNPPPTTSAGKTLVFWSVTLAVVLIAGAIIGYLFSQAQSRPVQVVVTATPEPSPKGIAQTEEQPPTKSATSTSTADNTNAPPTPSIMDFVLSDARHFQGSDEAPITMIEFSDFK